MYVWDIISLYEKRMISIKFIYNHCPNSSKEEGRKSVKYINALPYWFRRRFSIKHFIYLLLICNFVSNCFPWIRTWFKQLIPLCPGMRYVKFGRNSIVVNGEDKIAKSLHRCPDRCLSDFVALSYSWAIWPRSCNQTSLNAVLLAKAGK